MNYKRILSIVAIFLVACIGWWTLGTATTSRYSEMSDRLGEDIENLWGNTLLQRAPSLAVTIPDGERTLWLMPAKNDINVTLTADHRKRGLIWYPTYVCDFDGTYTITNEEAVAQQVRIHFDFPANGSTYDKFAMTIDGKPIQTTVSIREGVGDTIELAPGASVDFHVAYRTRGLGEWRYETDQRVGRVQNLRLAIQTNFENIDYPDGSLSPMSDEDIEGGKLLTWVATDLITQDHIGMIIPGKLNPGPLTSRITYFAPVCLLFFFVLVSAIGILKEINIHPMHYLFVAAGFFAFHLLLAYVVGIVNIHVAFILSAVVSVSMVTGYLSAALKNQLPRKIAIGGQLFFLVLFSYSFFLDGITGLTVAIGSVVTLGVLMKLTAHVDWDQVFKNSNTDSSPSIPPIPETQHSSGN